jgi:hypothetical protein
MNSSTDSINSTNSTNSIDSDGGFLKGLNLSAFMDVYQEWHAFVEGFCEVMCPWPARHRLSGELLTDLQGDHHYYAFGRVVGVVAWLVIAAIVKAVFF